MVNNQLHAVIFLPFVQQLANSPGFHFADESIPVLVVLESGHESQFSNDQYQLYISRISVSIEVVAVEGHNKSEPTARSNEGIHVLHIAAINDENSTRFEADNHGRRLSIWKVVVPLGREESPSPLSSS